MKLSFSQTDFVGIDGLRQFFYTNFENSKEKYLSIETTSHRRDYENISNLWTPDTSTWWCSNSIDPSPCIYINLLKGKIDITSYTILSHGGDGEYIKSWKFEGIEQDENVIQLDSHKLSTNQESKSINREVSGMFSSFKICQTGTNTDDTNIMVVSSFDIYGTYYPYRNLIYSGAKISNCPVSAYLIFCLI